MIDFAGLSIEANLAIFAVAVVAVWLAGTRLTVCADNISAKFGIGEAVVGLFLLALVTSLPEMATSFTAAQSGNAPLAVNNLLGSIAMQIAVLAVADFLIGRHALTSVVPNPVIMLQGSLNIILLSFVAIAILVGDWLVLGSGAWSWGLALASIYSFWKVSEAANRKPWIANLDEDLLPDKSTANHAASKTYILGATALASAGVILIAGYMVAKSGEVIADKSGLGSSFVGVAFVAIATSLPEASTVFASMRRGLYTMAISDILGTNILNVLLLFGVDAVATGEPVLTLVGQFAALAAMLGVVLTGLFLLGLAERRDRTIGRMGIDSAMVLIVYGLGLYTLYTMRDGVG